MNKTLIMQALLEALVENLHRQQAANEQASAGATDSESRAETKWDTCGLESSYLARGHALHFQELVAQIDELRGMTAPDFSGHPIGAGALVEANLGGEAMFFFQGREVTIITPESPIGAAMLDKNQGDSFSFRAGSSGKILSVK